MKWVIAILMISILVLFHEFGHFIVAKLSGVEVEEFSLGFGPRLISTVRGKTRYSLKLLLFGGSCLMKGMYPDDSDEDEDSDGQENEIPGDEESEEGSFQSASIGRRIAIVLAGPFFNFILSFVCAVVIISAVGYDPAKVVSVTAGSSAEKAGLMAGDIITSFMGQGVEVGRDVDSWFVFNDVNAGETVTMTVDRGGEKKELAFTADDVTAYAMGINYTIGTDTAVLSAVSEGSPAAEAGLKAGDVITAVNGAEITDSSSLAEYFSENPLDGSEVTVAYERGGKETEVTLTPAERHGVSLGFYYNLGREKTDAVGVIRYSFVEIRYWIGAVLKSIGGMFTGRFSVNDLSGPVGIADVVGTAYEQSKDEGAYMTFLNMLYLIVALSANLGVMNLLPIPALDGGRFVFLLIEAISGRPVNKKIELAFQGVAAVLLMLLMVYVMYNDITKMLP